ncbi:MAG: LysM peptidoglycan-binding domain-containing protein [Endomicrobiia bacterium]
MRSIKRIHLILFLIILGAIALFIEYRRQPKQEKIKPEIEKTPESLPVKEIPIQKPEIYPEKKVEDFEKNARQTVAIAGEYWKIAKKEGRDLSKGQSTLRLAKVALNAGNYQEAIRLAKQSIEELKSAPKIGVNYKVVKGDCLWNIAKMKKHYGKGSMWVKIWRANEKIIPDFDLIYPGQILFIPKEKGVNLNVKT